jgi:capsular polysaccharide biosynthesis protein
MTEEMLAQRAAIPNPSLGNLIPESDDFGGNGWWHANGTAARMTGEVPPLLPGSAVIEHSLTEATRPDTGAIFGCVLQKGLAPAPMHVASVSVFLPPDFAGSVVGVLFSGVASWQIVNAKTTQFGTWQRIWVSARLPPDAAAVNPTLFVVGPAGTRLFTTCWQLEAGERPTAYVPGAISEEISAPPPDVPMASVAPAASAPARIAAAANPSPAAGRFYRRVTLDDLARELQSGPSARAPVERIPLPEAPALALPAPLNGTTSLARDGIGFHPDGDFAAVRLRHPPTHAYLLRGATVHGPNGTVTIGDRVIAETLPGSDAGEDSVWLPNRPVSVKLQAGYHLLSCIRDNYYHWLIDVLSRFRLADFERFARQPEATSPPMLLHPPLDSGWKRQSMALLIPKTLPRLVLEEEGRIEVAHLLYIPDLTGGVMNPHPVLLEAFDTMRASALGGMPPQAPWRKLYVSRAGSPNRVLANEAEVAARAEAAGFTQMLPASMSVPEQIRMFAEASHIIAPHGAGLTNILFCQPGTALCELHMDAYVHQAYRRLAALRGLRYFCAVGAMESPRRPELFQNLWHMDLDAIDAVLGDPSFTSAPPAAAPTAEPLPARRWWQRIFRRDKEEVLF